MTVYPGLQTAAPGLPIPVRSGLQRPDGGAILAAVAEGDADVVLLNGLTAHARSVFSSPR